MRKSFKAGALTAPLPPVLVTVGDFDCANIITIGWTGILSTVPPRTYISVRPERYSYKLLRERREFVINLPSVPLAWAVDYAGIYTGAKVDKFKECGFTKTPSREVSAPTIAECPVALECRVVEIIPMGTHDVFVADIVSVSCDESIVDAEGRMCFDRADLLAYAHGEYFSLGEKVGVFGFSTKTPKRKRYTPKSTEPKRKGGVPTAKKSNAKPSELTKGSKRVSSTPTKLGQSQGESRAEGHKPFYVDIAKKKKRGRRK